LTLEQVESMLDAFVRAEGEPESVQLSGGEPSIHPQILEMLAAASERGIPPVMLNTTGIRLARDPRFPRPRRARRPRLPAFRRIV
jgi:7,8-dihydro-6-hydroxymethylpterin dimethyltransferase